MFYYDTIAGKKILKSGNLTEFEGKISHLFTTKESFIKTKEENFIEAAKANRELILDCLKIKCEDLIEIKQTHGTNVIIGRGEGFHQNENAKTQDIIDDTDGVILYKPGSAAILNFADCTPVILYDPENNVIAGLHAGWRGTAGEISKRGLKIMKENFGTNPAKTLAVIGPCIAQENFECGIEVYEKLSKTVSGDEYDDSKLFIFNKDKVYPDLARVNARQLRDLGVENIEICGYKTSTDRENLFSYRAENGTASRISLVLKLKNPAK